MVDIEADGPIPEDYSMISFGAVIAEPSLSKTFYGKLRPLSEQWNAEALKVSGFTREETLGFNDPKSVMERFAVWIGENSKGRPIIMVLIGNLLTGIFTISWVRILLVFHQ
jgi:hypothetical protein